MLEIIYEDDYIICVSKPNNVLVHHAFHSRKISDETSLLQLLFEQKGQKYYPLHRLDRKTSGIILLAKETKYVPEFQKLFFNNEIQKSYYGIVRGFSPNELVIDTPVKGRDANVYREAETHLKTLNTIELNIPVKPYNTSRYSLVKLTPKTGRLHQLRIHMNKISHPLIGDPKYGDKNHNMMYEEHFNCSNLFLHAKSLSFIHPHTKENLKLKAPLPQNWSTIFTFFKWD